MGKNRIKGQTCANCGFQFRIEAQHYNYCPNCGQENHNPRQPILHYLAELLENLFHLDSKTWVTLRTLLLRPGTISKEYMANMRARYTPPFRLFILSLAVFIVALEAAQDTMVKKDVQGMNQMTMQSRMELLDDSGQVGFSDPFFNGKKIYFTVRQLRELKSIEPSSIKYWLQANNMPSWFLYRLEARMVKHNIESALTVEDFNRRIVRIHYSVILMMMPVSAFLIYLIFYRKGLLYYDSLVMSVHLYAFGLLFGIVVTILVLFLIRLEFLRDTTIVLPLVMTLSLVFNFIPTYKKVFALPWPSTIIRGVLIGILNMSVQILVFWLLAAYVA